MTACMLLVGVIAGAVTTVAGMGGGLVLLLVLAALLDDPLQALVLSSPALLVGNLHRTWSMRHAADWWVVAPLALGAVPAAFLVALWVADAPVAVIRWGMLGVALLAAVRGLGMVTWSPPRRWAVPVGIAAGAVQSTAGGSGVLLAPYLMGRGLSGRGYVATMAAVAVMLHVSRLSAFGAGGLVDLSVLVLGAAIALSIVVGNALGMRVASWMDARAQRRAQVAVLLGTALLAAVGMR